MNNKLLLLILTVAVFVYSALMLVANQIDYKSSYSTPSITNGVVERR